MNSINFTANLMKHTQILKRDENGCFSPVKASVVELDKNDEQDLKSLHDTTVLWNYQGAKYSSNIYHEAVKGYEYDDVEGEHYLALTTQNENHDKLDPDKVLGLMLFSNERFDTDEITWFQVRPNTNTKQSWNREYKGVGKAMIDYIKQVNFFKPIHAMSVPESVEFYKKQGFEPHEDDIPSSLYYEG